METVKNLSLDEIKKKISTLSGEHSELNQKVDMLAKKEIMTPEDEMELKRLRKIKLHKKDMLTYLSSMVEKN